VDLSSREKLTALHFVLQIQYDNRGGPMVLTVWDKHTMLKIILVTDLVKAASTLLHLSERIV
jgi:hypothetical protein